MFSKLFIKILTRAIILIIIYMLFMFIFVIPNVEKNSMQLEEREGRLQLDKIVQIVKNASMDMQLYKKSALRAHKQEIVRLTSIIWQIIDQEQKKYHNLSPKKILQKQQEILRWISKLKYENDGYFFVSNYNSKLIAHPYLQNKNFLYIEDVYGNLIVPPMVKIAKKRGSGFISYWWKKDSKGKKIYKKLSYVKNFKPWHWVIGTGVYINDINKEIKRRKQMLIMRLKQILNHTKIGKSGYVYIFNQNSKIIIHPDKNLEGKYLNKKLSPGTNTYIFNDLVNAYKYGNKKLYYTWDKPSDKGDFKYKKVSWIGYNPYFKWYICSSGYLKEFHLVSKKTKIYLLYMISFGALFITLLGFYLLRRLLYPINELSQVATEIEKGNLKARYTGVINDDETGVLATVFNQMLDKIDNQMTTLDKRVQDKTKKLSNLLCEKENLLKELNHRIKNNLFIINGIIGLHSFGQTDTNTKEIIQNIQNKIQAIALVHEMLSDETDTQLVDMQKYIQKLSDSLFLAFSDSNIQYKCDCRIQSIKLSIDHVYPIGIIINELITNAIKYALTDENKSFKISMYKESNNFIILKVEDNGKGFDRSKTKGLGLQLVEMSVKQLHATITYNLKGGTHIIIKIPN